MLQVITIVFLCLIAIIGLGINIELFQENREAFGKLKREWKDNGDITHYE